MRRRISLVAAALMVTACGEIPQPFRHEGAPPSLARPKMVRGVTIRPLDGFAAAEPLAAAMVKAMGDREIAAIIRSGPAFGHVVEGRMDSDGVVLWSLRAPDGAEAASHRQRLPSTADGANVDTANVDVGRLKRLAIEAVATLAAPLAQDPDAIPKRDGGLAERPTVRILPLAGLPGDGDKALGRALRVALDRAGLYVVEADGDFLVQGAVLLSPLTATEENAAVNWTVKRAKGGVQLASIDQGGALPKGRLALPWGALARDIAEGGAAGIAEVVQAAQRKRPTALTIPAEVTAEAAPAATPDATPGGPTQFTEPRPADISEPDSREQNDEARKDAVPAPAIAPPPAKVSPAKPAKTVTPVKPVKPAKSVKPVKKAFPIKATGANRGRAKAKVIPAKLQTKRAQR